LQIFNSPVPYVTHDIPHKWLMNLARQQARCHTPDISAETFICYWHLTGHVVVKIHKVFISRTWALET